MNLLSLQRESHATKTESINDQRVKYVSHQYCVVCIIESALLGRLCALCAKPVKLGDLLSVFSLVAGAALGVFCELPDLPIEFVNKRLADRHAVIALDQSLH